MIKRYKKGNNKVIGIQCTVYLYIVYLYNTLYKQSTYTIDSIYLCDRKRKVHLKENCKVNIKSNCIYSDTVDTSLDVIYLMDR